MSSRTRVRAFRGLLVLILLAAMCFAGADGSSGRLGAWSSRRRRHSTRWPRPKRHARTTPCVGQAPREEVQEPAGAMKQAVELRKISLKALEAACGHYSEHNNGELPDAVKYLGGLQRVQYVLVYPEHNDIVLVGPAEGWKVDPLGNIVGVTTGRPVLQLEDLIVALRTVESAATRGHQLLHQPHSGRPPGAAATAGTVPRSKTST